MLLKRDRYDSVALAAQLEHQTPHRDVSEWCVELKAFDAKHDVEDFCAYLPDEESDHPAALELLHDFLLHIRELDNLVQESCQREFERSNFSLSDFKLHIGYLDLSDEMVVVRYFGTVVNTEWCAEFQRLAPGHWKKLNF